MSQEQHAAAGGSGKNYIILGIAGLVVAGVIAASLGLFGDDDPSDLETVELAFCSQILCVLPFEVARDQGYFVDEGIDISLNYMQGGAVAMVALQEGSIDFVGTTMDVILSTVDAGNEAVMLTSTAQLPFFALVIGPDYVDEITEFSDLEGRVIGVGNTGTTDHLLMEYLLRLDDVDTDQVEFFAAGANLRDLIAAGELEAGMVQEPALTYLQEQGAVVLMNFMSVEQAEETLGGTYQFMGLITRPDALEDEGNQDLARKLVRALVRGQQFIRENPGVTSVQALPADLLSPDEYDEFGAILDQHKENLYTADGFINPEAVIRVLQVRSETLTDPGRIVPEELFTNEFNEYVGD